VPVLVRAVENWREPGDAIRRGRIASPRQDAALRRFMVGQWIMMNAVLCRNDVVLTVVEVLHRKKSARLGSALEVGGLEVG
jgi:hypothetical protein